MSRRKSADKIAIFIRDDWTCADCGGVFEDTPLTTVLRLSGESDLWNKVGNHITIDHILPVCQGGTNAQTNLQAMCYVCNNLKGDGMRVNNTPKTPRMTVTLETFIGPKVKLTHTQRRREQRKRAAARLRSSV